MLTKRPPVNPLKSRPAIVVLILMIIGLVVLVIHNSRNAIRNPEIAARMPQDKLLLKQWDEGRTPVNIYSLEESRVISVLGSPDEVIWPGQDNAREKSMPPLHPGEKYLVYGSHALKISNGKTNGEYRVENRVVY